MGVKSICRLSDEEMHPVNLMRAVRHEQSAARLRGIKEPSGALIVKVVQVDGIARMAQPA